MLLEGPNKNNLGKYISLAALGLKMTERILSASASLLLSKGGSLPRAPW